MVAVDPWDHLGLPVMPMLLCSATVTVVLTVAVGTQCPWYGLTGSLDAEQSLRAASTGYFILYET